MNSLGFTLTETLVVLALTTLLINLSLSYGIDTYERGLARTDRTLLLAGIREARSEALSGICIDTLCNGPSAHGIEITSTSFTLFEGDSFASRHTTQDETIPFASVEQVSGDTEIVFLAQSAELPTLKTFILTSSDNRSEHIFINTEGGISETVIATSTP